MSYPVDNRCPRVTNENWEECCRKGWRHHANAPGNRPQEIGARLQALQALHGILSVAVGYPFSDEALKPQRDQDELQIGIYICDISDQVSDLYRELEEWG